MALEPSVLGDFGYEIRVCCKNIHCSYIISHIILDFINTHFTDQLAKKIVLNA